MPHVESENQNARNTITVKIFPSTKRPIVALDPLLDLALEVALEVG